MVTLHTGVLCCLAACVGAHGSTPGADASPPPVVCHVDAFDHPEGDCDPPNACCVAPEVTIDRLR